MTAASDRPLLEVADRAELRAWLERNHSTSPGVLLAVGKKGRSATRLTYDDAVEEGLCFGWIDSTARRLDADRYTMLFTPRRPGSTWAASNKERVKRLSAAGLMMPAGLAAIERARSDGSWDLLTDVEALIVPDDLATALDATAGARKGFESLNDSGKQMALFWIASAKREDTRRRRIEATVAAAVKGKAPTG